MAKSVDPDQTAPIGAVCSWSTLFASILNWSVMLGNYLQQTTSADDIFRSIFFLVLCLAIYFKSPLTNDISSTRTKNPTKPKQKYKYIRAAVSLHGMFSCGRYYVDKSLMAAMKVQTASTCSYSSRFTFGLRVVGLKILLFISDNNQTA